MKAFVFILLKQALCFISVEATSLFSSRESSAIAFTLDFPVCLGSVL